MDVKVWDFWFTYNGQAAVSLYEFNQKRCALQIIFYLFKQEITSNLAYRIHKPGQKYRSFIYYTVRMCK